MDGLRREKDKLERQRKKLLEAHYNDAIPLDLMKSEQQKITRHLTAIEHQLASYKNTFKTISDHLKDVFDLIENCGMAYRWADEHTKRMMNQAIFSKLLVESDGRITAEFTKPFKSIVTPITDVLAHYKQEKARGTEITTDFLSVIANRISHFFGYGLNNELLVDDTGLEPVTSRTSTQKCDFL